MELIPPAPHFLNSYLEACQETWGHVHSTYILHDPSQYARWKDTIFQQFENEKRGIGLPPGYVPSTTFWLICGERFIGSGNIRHFLNASLREYGGQIGDFIRLSERGKGYGSLLLRMLLSKAEEMGIRETLNEIVRHAAPVQQRFLVVLPRKMHNLPAGTVLEGQRDEAGIGGKAELDDDVGGFDAEMGKKLFSVELERGGSELAGERSTREWSENRGYLI